MHSEHHIDTHACSTNPLHTLAHNICLFSQAAMQLCRHTTVWLVASCSILARHNLSGDNGCSHRSGSHTSPYCRASRVATLVVVAVVVVGSCCIVICVWTMTCMVHLELHAGFCQLHVSKLSSNYCFTAFAVILICVDLAVCILHRASCIVHLAFASCILHVALDMLHLIFGFYSREGVYQYIVVVVSSS